MFSAGVLLLSESPRWLARRGRLDQARAALQRTVPAPDVDATLAQMQASLQPANGVAHERDRLLSRRYV